MPDKSRRYSKGDLSGIKSESHAGYLKANFTNQLGKIL